MPYDPIFRTKRHDNLFVILLLAAALFTAQPALHAEEKININTAKFEQLMDIPEINEELAAKILKYRKDNKSFKTIYDMMKIPEINGELFEKIQSRITVGDKPAAPAQPATAAVKIAPQQNSAAPAKTAAQPSSASRIAETDQEPQQPEQAAPPADQESSDEGRKTGDSPAPGGQSRTAARGRIDDREIKRIDMSADNYFKVIMGLMRLARYDKAEKNLTDFISRYPQDQRTDDSGYLLGACSEEAEKYAEAIERYKKVYDNQKSEMRGIALFRIAVCCDLSGKTGEAVEYYRKYVSEFPESSCVKDAENRLNAMLKTK